MHLRNGEVRTLISMHLDNINGNKLGNLRDDYVKANGCNTIVSSPDENGIITMSVIYSKGNKKVEANVCENQSLELVYPRVTNNPNALVLAVKNLASEITPKALQ